MIRLVTIGVVASVLLGAGGCASGEQSGATSQQEPRTYDRLDPVDAFPQARGANPYMRQ